MAVSHVQRRDSATGAIPSNTSSHMGSGMAANTNSKAGIVAKLLEALSAFAHVCKRRIPTVIAVVLLLAVWEAWVRIGNVPSTMIAAQQEMRDSFVDPWR